ncbi:hypothetical protein ETAA8_19930 [Anatilimnocola aggregata]|uniref:UDP-N-acetylglucosamine kinase n=1 Tax=Anatilimnocola aggregata TaxID=2528021 RepID=A0A517Y9K1_9BACT|nr:AAA family ATPase [Anatilimnocola aggregata]QDU26909.1 hypothetical protein ETAA8_19930 [Anatilimnocola aggregata]
MSARELIIVGGPNGAGKTTFALEDLARRGGVYLSADAIAAEISPGNPTAAAIEAGRLFIERFALLLQSDGRLIVESTIAGKSSSRMLFTARQRGFAVTLVFVFLASQESSLSRIHARVLNGGHNVLASDVRRRFPRAIANFWNIYRLLADDWLLVYNGQEELIAVAYGVVDQVLTLDENCYAQFHRLLGRQLT